MDCDRFTGESVTPRELQAASPAGSRRLVDIRKNPDERQIPGSIRLDGSALEDGSAIPFDRDDEIVLYCGSGNSCSRVAKTLRERGYRAVALEGGYKAWVDAGFPTEPRER
jgi:tRNA 2-thiocytidine biosynthesis protein TtcA